MKQKSALKGHAPGKDPAVKGAQVIARALKIVDLVAENDRDGVRLADIVQRTALTAPTAHRLLRSLEAHRYVKRSPETGAYHLGPHLVSIGYMALSRHGIERTAQRALGNIARLSGDTVLLTIRNGWHSLCIDRVEGEYPIRSHVLQPGDRHPLGVSSGGLAILATLPDDEIRECLAGNAAEVAATFPIFTPQRIWELVRETRRNGYALNPGQIVVESYGIAVAVPEPGHSSRTAFTIAGIASRITGERQDWLANILKTEATGFDAMLSGGISPVS